MAKYREIRSRIQGIENTAKITSAMKMVAAAKLRRAQDGIIAARPYGAKLREMLQYLASSMEVAVSPLLEEREVNRVCLVVIAADRGLCGAFMDSRHPEVGKAILEKKQLDDEVKGLLNKALAEFKDLFQAEAK